MFYFGLIMQQVILKVTTATQTGWHYEVLHIGLIKATSLYSHTVPNMGGGCLDQLIQFNMYSVFFPLVSMLVWCLVCKSPCVCSCRSCGPTVYF